MSADAPFDTLTALLRPYAGRMRVKRDDAQELYLEETRSGTKPQLFAAVQIKKSYVALHAFALYLHPEWVADLSDPLRKRMQGKSCFNFRPSDDIPVPELTALFERAEIALG